MAGSRSHRARLPLSFCLPCNNDLATLLACRIAVDNLSFLRACFLVCRPLIREPRCSLHWHQALLTTTSNSGAQ